MITHSYPTDFYLWLPVAEIARSEGVTPRQIYWAMDHGLAHSRAGGRIRVRRIDWHAYHEANAVGELAPTPRGALSGVK